MTERPKVGLSLLVLKPHGTSYKALLSARKGSHGADEYGTPGGHMEHGETFEEGALRELAEECGDDFLVTQPQFLCVSNVLDYLPKHYVDIGMVAHWVSGEPVQMEPEKAGPWGWYPLDDLPSPLFAVVDSLVEARLGGPVCAA